MTTEPTPTPSAGIASEMSNEQLAAEVKDTADVLRERWPKFPGYSDELDEAARRLRLTPDRPKGGGEEWKQRVQEIIHRIPASGPQGELFVVHHDENGEETGVEHVDPMAVISCIAGALNDLIAAPPAPPSASAQRNESGATGREDIRRLDILEKNGRKVKLAIGYGGSKDAWYYEKDGNLIQAESLRAAIDAIA